MPDFLLELRSEEIPARMQARAREDLARLFAEQLNAAGLAATAIATFATPRRLALIARALPSETQSVSEERRGPRVDAPAQALEGFLKSTGLARAQLEERTDKKGVFLYAVIARPGRPIAQVLAEAVPAIVRAFPWPKSMRWGAASTSTESPRWVRPLQGIVALFGEDIVPLEVAGVTSGGATLGHRFHHPGPITIGSADDYEAKLRACHVVLDGEERARIIRDGARAAAAAAGLTLVEDESLVAENAGLTEWPVPLLGAFDPAFLDVPREAIQLTMRTNQKYFALTYPPRASLGEGGGGAGIGEGAAPPSALRAATSPSKLGEDLAPAFICTANIEAPDGGAAIVAGNQRVLSARLSDARFFWEADLEVPLEEQAAKLGDIVFHEKLGTVADKVERVAKLARWLVEEGIVGGAPTSKPDFPEPVEGPSFLPHARTEEGDQGLRQAQPSRGLDRSALANLATRAARLCKADLVTQSVGEFPELQGILGAHLARAQGENPQVCDAIRDHYKPVGQGDEVPTAPVTVAVSLADKLDTLIAFDWADIRPTGSRDPFALRRAALAVIATITSSGIRIHLGDLLVKFSALLYAEEQGKIARAEARTTHLVEFIDVLFINRYPYNSSHKYDFLAAFDSDGEQDVDVHLVLALAEGSADRVMELLTDRLKVQQREAGVRHDLIDAVFALGGEDDLVRLLARVRALQAFVETGEGRDLLAGYKRAANILKKEGWSSSPLAGEGKAASADEGEGAQALSLPPLRAGGPSPARGEGLALSYTPEPVESSLIAALDSAEPRVRVAVEGEDFGGAMAALASLRAPVDAFFESVTVNDPDPARRQARLDLLARMRDAFHRVADFSRIEG